jgi:16S rRNA (cytidine1402-2'-O)-methyltransferase
MENRVGKMSIVTTPIGNLQDITLRALETLKEADIIVAEDTRHSKRLLNHFEIKKKLISCHSYNEHHAAAGIISLIKDKQLKIAVLSDAGTPVIADPGFHIIREARNAGIEPEFIPGVSALTFAVAASGLPADKFSFFGFAPVKKGKRERLLLQIKEEGRTAFLFESPYRITKLLTAVEEVVGSETEIAIIREATKLHEETIRGKVSEILKAKRDSKWKGEFVIGIFPDSQSN